MDCSGTNVFLSGSELALCGRPLNEEPVMLPLSRDIILPESLSPDGDLRGAERQRSSVETCSAQKGTGRWASLLQALLAGPDLKGKPVIVLNLTGYIEDCGVADSRTE